MAIKLELELTEVNVVLAALAKQPFEAVASVINKIQQQGAPQVESQDVEEVPTE